VATLNNVNIVVCSAKSKFYPWANSAKPPATSHQEEVIQKLKKDLWSQRTKASLAVSDADLCRYQPAQADWNLRRRSEKINVLFEHHDWLLWPNFSVFL